MRFPKKLLPLITAPLIVSCSAPSLTLKQQAMLEYDLMTNNGKITEYLGEYLVHSSMVPVIKGIVKYRAGLSEPKKEDLDYLRFQHDPFFNPEDYPQILIHVLQDTDLDKNQIINPEELRKSNKKALDDWLLTQN